jgi:multidrug efflux pump subunit AcrA (membrane-fusion protein)
MVGRRGIIGLGCLVVCGGALAQDGAVRPASPARSAPAVAVTGEEGIVREFAGSRAFTKPSKDAVMGFSLPTQVMEVFVKGGQEVKKGDPLVRGDDIEDKALLALQKLLVDTDWPVQKAKNELDKAKLGLDNILAAKVKGGTTDQEVDVIRLNHAGAGIDYENAKLNQAQQVLQYDRLKARVDRLTLAAPVDGKVDLVAVEAGQVVGDGEKIVRVVNIDPLWIDVPATMTDLATLRVKEHDPAWVLVQIAGKFSIREGKVIEVSPVSDPGSRTRRVRVELPNTKGEEQLVAGEPAWVRLAAPSAEVKSKVAVGGAENPGK